MLENLAHQVLAVDPAGTDLSSVLDAWEDRSRAVRVRERTAYDDRSGWLVTTVGARGQDWGRLVLMLGRTPTAREHMLIERGAATVALSRLVERDRESLERQSHRTLLTGVIAGSVSLAETTTRAGALGVPLEGRALVAVLVRLGGTPTGPALETQERLRDFSETVSAAVRDTRAVALVGAVDDLTVGVLLSLPPREDVDRALERLSAALTKRASTGRSVVGDDDWVMAVGSVVAGARDVRRAFLEAAQVADAAPGTRLPSPTTDSPTYACADSCTSCAMTTDCRPSSNASSGRCSSTTPSMRPTSWECCGSTSPPDATSRSPRTPRICRGLRSTSGCTGLSACFRSTSTRWSHACLCTSHSLRATRCVDDVSRR